MSPPVTPGIRTAGGAGDGHLFAADQTSDYPCQDGGFEPFTKPTGEPQEKEREKEKTPLEIEEFNKKNAKEKIKDRGVRNCSSRYTTVSYFLLELRSRRR